jgi:hypothetical protein
MESAAVFVRKPDRTMIGIFRTGDSGAFSLAIRFMPLEAGITRSVTMMLGATLRASSRASSPLADS